MSKRKTKARKSCPSKRAYASGKKKGRCVPKKKRRSTGCYARTLQDGVRKLRVYRKRLKAIKRKRHSGKATIHEVKSSGGFWGLRHR